MMLNSVLMWEEFTMKEEVKIERAKYVAQLTMCMLHATRTPNHVQDFFVPEFLAALDNGHPEALRSILTEVLPGVFTFQMWTNQFCE